MSSHLTVLAFLAASLVCSGVRRKGPARDDLQLLHGADARLKALSLFLFASNPRHSLLQFRGAGHPSSLIHMPRSSMRRTLSDKSASSARVLEPDRIFRVPTQVSMNAIVPQWQGENGKRHRFLNNSGGGLLDECDLYGGTCRTPSKYTGLRSLGVSGGSYRLDFILNGRDGDKQKALELLESIPNSNPSFGAVRVPLPLDFTLVASGSNLVVGSVRQYGNSFLAGIRENDIIRAVSIPVNSEERQKDETPDTLLNASVVWAPVPVFVPLPGVPVPLPWPVPLPFPAQLVPERIRPENVLRQVRDIATRVPKTEEGLVFLNDKSLVEFDRLMGLEQNWRASGSPEVVLVIERPFDPNALTDAEIADVRRNLSPGALIGDLGMIQQSVGEPKYSESQGRKILDPEARQAAIDEMLKDLPDILSEELNWDLYAEDFHIVDDLGDRWDGKEDNRNLVNLLRNLVSTFVAKYTCEPKVQVVNGEIVGEWYVGLFGLELPVLPFQSFIDIQIDLTVKTTYRFNDANLVDELVVEKFFVNGERIGLPPVDSAAITPENIKKIIDWAQPLLARGILSKRAR